MYVLATAPDRPTTIRRGWRRWMAATAVAAGALVVGAGATADAESPWDRLAQCESSGNWAINTGNGYYGGLQFSRSSWEWAGGQRHARWPNGATKAQQIQTGRRLLHLQSASSAWPTCTARLRLTRADLLGRRRASSPATASSTASGGGTSRSARAAAPATAAGPSSTRSNAPTSPPRRYRVRPGDSLATIAARTGVRGGWPALHRANDDRISNPGVIFVGQVLRLPGGGDTATPARRSGPAASTSSGTRRHRVRAGETLSSIASRSGVTGGWGALYRANDGRIANPNVIHVGQVLRLP